MIRNSCVVAAAREMKVRKRHMFLSFSGSWRKSIDVEDSIVLEPSTVVRERDAERFEALSSCRKKSSRFTHEKSISLIFLSALNNFIRNRLTAKPK